MRHALAVVLVLAAASAAPADLVLEVTENAPPAAGLASYTLTFKGVTVGDRFVAFEGALRGPMSQTWYFTKGQWDKTPWIGDFYPGEEPDAALDSHLLVDKAHVLIVVDVAEDADTSTSFGTTPAGYDRFLGTYMANSATTDMAFAVPVAFQQVVQPFAQVVIPAGQTVHLSGIAVSFDYRYLPLDVEIPEPATLSLLGLSGLALLRFRRRRRSRRQRRAHAPTALRIGLLSATLGGLVLAAGVAPAGAQALPNGGFETGDFTSWTRYVPPGASADVVAQHTDGDGNYWSPTEGAYFGLLKTDGSAAYTRLYQSFLAGPGDTLEFDWFFETRDWDYANDHVRYRILDAVGAPVHTEVLASVSSGGIVVGDYGQTGWHHETYTLAAGGSYSFHFEITNNRDSSFDSYAGIDNVVPEPATLGLLGLASLAILRRKSRRQASVSPLHHEE